jgi:hypothetical protein
MQPLDCTERILARRGSLSRAQRPLAWRKLHLVAPRKRQQRHKFIAGPNRPSERPGDGENLLATGRQSQPVQPKGVQPPAGAGAISIDSKPHALCAPSQNGRFAECPQRHKATAGLSGFTGNALPFWSTIVTGPSIKNGPFGRTRIVTLLIGSHSLKPVEMFLAGGRRPCAVRDQFNRLGKIGKA